MAVAKSIKVDVVVNTKVNISFWEAIKLRIAGESVRQQIIKNTVAKAAEPTKEHVKEKVEKKLSVKPWEKGND